MTTMESDAQRPTASRAPDNQDLDDFVHIVSHDLKEPLRGVANNAMFLKEDYENRLDERGVKRLDRMVFLCQRMERLIDDLLYFSRLGRQKLALQRTDLTTIVRDIASRMEATLRERGAVIELPQPLPTVVCDTSRITELFQSLIDNAVKFNKSDRKRIEIGCIARPGSTPADAEGPVFYVRDNGIGVPREFHHEIFHIFKRLNEEDDAHRGSGVGLTFAQKIVERHNGRIWLESDVGEGTTFYFTLSSAGETAGR